MKYVFTVLIMLACLSASPQPEGFNYDESKVPQFVLPDPLAMRGGRKVKSVKVWENKKRPETLRLFEEQKFGKIPEELKMTSFRVMEESDKTPYSNAIRKQVEMLLEKDGKELRVEMLIYLPKSQQKVPLFVSAIIFMETIQLRRMWK
jgi:hypothetical protein